MKHIEHNLKAIKRRIMLRVWFSYLVSLINNRVAVAGVIFGASLSLFVQLVSVTNILHNLMQVRLGAVPEYIWQTLVRVVVNGEFLKLLTLVLIVASLWYLRSLVHHARFANRFAH